MAEGEEREAHVRAMFHHCGAHGLSVLWQVVEIDRVTEFTKHHCSHDLKKFLDVTAWITGGGKPPEGGTEELDDSTGSGGGADMSNSGSQAGKVSESAVAQQHLACQGTVND